MLGGIVAEFNPFHNGHKYLIEKARENCDGVVAVMSPNVCQRGEFSVYDKFNRAKAAVSEGVDLVVELPCAAAVSAAPDFAKSATEILLSLGIDALVFGTECEGVEELYEAGRLLCEMEKSGDIKEALKEGKSYPRTISERLGEDFLTPNNILALEYMKNLPKSVRPIAVKRVGASHDGEETKGIFASASFIRGAAKEEGEKFIPEKAAAIFSEMEKFPVKYAEEIMFSYLKRLSSEEIKKAPGVYEGLENRIKDALKGSSDFEELKEKIKTKRYTMARIRRILTALFLRLEKGDEKPQYIRVLAFNERGREILSSAKKKSPLPIITALGDAKKISPAAEKQAEKESFCTDMYNLCSKKRLPDGEDFRFSPIPFNK
jgi:cytidyltransferase-like protein